ncbi:hypothetical protein K466DRAFT_506106 [Polyporus arcularius HHB13444]|uniref:Uncharacterized protein n=1 Tax=Polyporus arcularius HHB13444 TaxID=1314778 RepID=A0A5C3P059_9APHY|nr:hypothetical protein K466DRAFT_506106 [Polyporus arcularius HHB13444]
MGKWTAFNGFSPLKKAAVLSNLRKARSAQENKENLPTSTLAASSTSGVVPTTAFPSEPSNPELQQALKAAQAQLAVVEGQVSSYKREIYNTHRREVRARNSKTELKHELEEAREQTAVLEQHIASLEGDVREVEEARARANRDVSRLQERNSVLDARNEALIKRVKRAPSQAARAVQKAVKGAVHRATTFTLKEQGIISEDSRDLVHSLTSAGVPRDKIPETISTVVKAAGLTVKGSMSTRSVGRINLEGGILSDLQTMEDMKDADGITLSSDGTGIKHIQHEARHAYINKGSTHTRHFLGVTTAPSHTSEEQLRGWIDALESLCTTWNASPRGQQEPLSVADILSKIKGMNTDHAEDQKKLVRLFMELKVRTDRERRGQRAILEGALAEFEPFAAEETADTIRKAGGLSRWEQLPGAERAAHVHEATRRATVRFGETRFAALSEEEKRAADLFVWAGCCMHKELNSVKGGAAALASFWKDNDLPPSTCVRRQRNYSIKKVCPDESADRATEVSQGGAVKLTSLAGALFRHKDEKKGQQDTVRIFFEAAEALLVYLPLYREFLEVVRDKKDSRTWTNLEQNVYSGLHDDSTLTELCVLALYSQAISHPYMRAVRGPDQLSANILDQGPLHERVKAHCRRIIENPDLLLSPDATYTTGSLDGQLWDRPEVHYTVLRMAPTLPHLRGALVAFFTGALETWKRFSVEFASDGLIASLSPAERESAWGRTTNDDNEGALGHARVRDRQAPRETRHQYNARQKGKVNDIAGHAKRKHNDVTKEYVRKRARVLDASGLAKKDRAAIAAHDRQLVKDKRTRDKQREAKQQEKTRVLDGLTLLLDTEDIRARAKAITNSDLDQQLDWHRRNEGKDTQMLAKSRYSKKAEKVEALCAAVDRYCAFQQLPEGLENGGQVQEAMESVVLENNGENLAENPDSE